MAEIRISGNGTGRDNFDQNLDAYISNLYRVALADIVRNAKRNSPYRTGALRRSIRGVRRGLRDAAIISNVHYTQYQEARRPFVVPAVRNTFGSLSRRTF